VTTPTGPLSWTVAQALKTLIEAHDSIDDTQVFTMWPGSKDEVPEMLIIEKVKASEVKIPVAQDGRKQRDEILDITFRILVADYATEALVMARTVALIGVIEDIFADDMTLGMAPTVWWSEVTGYDPSPSETDSGFNCITQVTATAKARIQ